MLVTGTTFHRDLAAPRPSYVLIQGAQRWR
jgi:hypothetical protein